mmetsp:Transcript_5745/g.9133  ORF Transcript_5745/g.9133 Transcript_5745/m.9133 type:complete len:185 (-) Transcript_5745:100-654(-)|eukprot:CAMPEP_0170497946 /NCGR_PEP_ID=MMETSP0208-20121228/26307_1 /TAXON_ID=197538 /ORGANISM="Strombidium inclinatum, Strain S3" /LENGTH=184 /DNA_ID=CAMNT_0010774933 /DNA_START=25 /DNA_END=579 /DNA_ORIENTATION=-
MSASPDFSLPWIYGPFEYTFSGMEAPNSLVGYLVRDFFFYLNTVFPFAAIIQFTVPFWLLVLATFGIGADMNEKGEETFGIFNQLFDSTGAIGSFMFFNLLTWEGYLMQYLMYFASQAFAPIYLLVNYTIALIRLIDGEIDVIDGFTNRFNWYDPLKEEKLAALDVAAMKAEEAEVEDAESTEE